MTLLTQGDTYDASILPIIRRAHQSDAGQIISGINAICTEGGAFYTKQFVSTPQWEAVLQRPETMTDHLLLVAEWNGKIVAVGRLFPGGEDTLFNHVAELGIFVQKPYRRRRIGTKLINQLFGWATEQSLEKITLTAFATNLPAIRFFEKHGFVQEGRMQRQIKTDGSYIDLVLLGYFL